MRLPIAGLRQGLIGQLGPVEGAPVGGELGVGQIDGVVTDQHVQRIAIERQIEFALAVAVVDQGAVIAIDRVELVGIEIGHEPVVLGLIEIIEELIELIGAAVKGRRNQVFALDGAL